MSQFAFTSLRLGFLVLLWIFVALVVRALRRDMNSTMTPSSPPLLRGRGKKTHAGPPPAPRRRGEIGRAHV